MCLKASFALFLKCVLLQMSKARCERTVTRTQALLAEGEQKVGRGGAQECLAGEGHSPL